MHLDGRKLGQYVRHVLEFRPVVLDVLTGGEMSVPAIVASCDRAQDTQLCGRQQSIGNGDAQHRRMALDIQAIAQAQVSEFIVVQLAGQESPCLIAKLRYAFVDERPVHCVITIHSSLI